MIDCTTLYNEIKLFNPDILVFEGFEMTGKSTVMKSLCSMSDKFLELHTDYSKITESLLPYRYRYVSGIVQLDTINKANSKLLKPMIPVLDRSVPSSYVYNLMYNQGINQSDMRDIINLFKYVTKGKQVQFIHMTHDSKYTAEYIYHKSVNDNNHSDKYDKFSNFNEYWKSYRKFEQAYENFYDSFDDGWIVSYRDSTKLS